MANPPVYVSDAFAIVAAQQFDGIVVTGDPEFQDVTELVRVEWLMQDR